MIGNENWFYALSRIFIKSLNHIGSLSINGHKVKKQASAQLGQAQVKFNLKLLLKLC